MHILLIPSWYKTKKEPFMGTFFEEQARATMKLGHQAGVLYPAYFPPAELFSGKGTQVDSFDDNGLPTSRVFVQTKIPRSRRLNYQSFCKRVASVFDRYVGQHGKPDIIHAHSVFYGGIAAWHIANRYDIPLVITEHLTAYIMGTISHDYDRQLARDIFNGADASLIVSENFKGDIEKEMGIGSHVFRVVHNMVADLFFEDLRVKPFQVASEPFILFTNSFLLPRKNHKLIFDMLRVLLDRKLNVRLRVGGDGMLRDELKRYAKEIGIDDHVEFLGGLTRRQVKEQVSDSHAFVLASFYETFGVVLIESLACGRPVITTDSGGPRDFINDSNGEIVREFSPGKMAAAVERVLRRYDEFDQQAISRSCFDRFNEKRIAGALESVYRDVLAKRREA